MLNLIRTAIAVVSLCSLGAVQASSTPHIDSLKEDRVHIDNWNRFADRLLQLHQALITLRPVRSVETTGGYSGRPDFYRQVSYFDRATGHLLSRLQWERNNPTLLHEIEVYIYNADGHLMRDYLAAYLPDHRNAPIQTLINLHQQNQQIQGFRQFDASGALIYESCQGELDGQPIQISLWEDQLVRHTDEVFNTPGYALCFQGLAESGSAYLDPLIDLPQNTQAELDLSPLTYVTNASSEQLQRYIDKISKKIGTAKTTQAELYSQRAAAYFLLHQFDASIRDYDQALALQPSFSEAYFGRGLSKGRAGQIAEGIADIGVYLQKNPTSSLAYTKRGVRYLWLGDIDNAERDLTKAIHLNPENAEAHDDLGVILAQRGDTKIAIEHFSTTIRIDPSYQKAHHNLAMALYIVGKKQQALMSINNALQLNPDEQNSLLLKAEILDALGEKKLAAQIRNDAEFLPGGNWSEQFSVQR